MTLITKQAYGLLSAVLALIIMTTLMKEANALPIQMTKLLDRNLTSAYQHQSLYRVKQKRKDDDDPTRASLTRIYNSPEDSPSSNHQATFDTSKSSGEHNKTSTVNSKNDHIKTNHSGNTQPSTNSTKHTSDKNTTSTQQQINKNTTSTQQQVGESSSKSQGGTKSINIDWPFPSLNITSVPTGLDAVEAAAQAVQETLQNVADEISAWTGQSSPSKSDSQSSSKSGTASSSTSGLGSKTGTNSSSPSGSGSKSGTDSPSTSVSGSKSGTNSSSASGSESSSVNRTRVCGQPENTNKTIDAISRSLQKQKLAHLQHIAGDSMSTDANGGRNTAAQAIQRVMAQNTKTIDVNFHVIHDGDTGKLSEDVVKNQIQQLNKAYSDYGFSFSLENVTYSDNKSWFRGVTIGNELQTEMKKALHKGDEKTLNFYTVDFPDNLLGYATFPWEQATDPQDDGVVFLYSTVPGGNAKGYNQGKTAVHETGHWLGLYHTFQGGCDGDGDDVDDTPAEAEPTEGCPKSKDTCSSAGTDPIHNYLDYSTDECLNQFTQGQAVRMSALSSHYRSL